MASVLALGPSGLVCTGGSPVFHPRDNCPEDKVSPRRGFARPGDRSRGERPHPLASNGQPLRHTTRTTRQTHLRNRAKKTNYCSPRKSWEIAGLRNYCVGCSNSSEKKPEASRSPSFVNFFSNVSPPISASCWPLPLTRSRWRTSHNLRTR